MLCAIPVVIAGLVNTIFGVPVISGWIQSALDKLYAFARGSMDAGWQAPDPRSESLQPSRRRLSPGMWQCAGTCSVRAKFSIPLLSPSIVPFGEFLRTRLEAYGEVQMIDETPRRPEAESAEHGTSIIVMPVDVPYSPDALNKVARIAVSSDVSHSFIAELRLEKDLRPHRQGTFKISRDPEFAQATDKERVITAVGPYGDDVST